APVSDSMELRNDFRFMSMGEALWAMLGNRLDNPGVAGATGGPTPSRIRYRALGLSDAGAVAYANGVVVNPQVSPTVLETALGPTIGAVAGFPSQRFEPDMINGTGQWFPMFDPATATYQIRHLLVTRN